MNIIHNLCEFMQSGHRLKAEGFWRKSRPWPPLLRGGWQKSLIFDWGSFAFSFCSPHPDLRTGASIKV